MQAKASGPLAGLRVIEMAGIGPGPFCGMLLADLGADVVVVDRVVRNAENLDLGERDIGSRGKRRVQIDLKSPDGIAQVLELVAQADALIEGMRPGVMERLGLGPDVCLARNPRLAFGRMTGWGQTGPLAHAAGHDLNYIALSGSLWYAGQPGEPPITPPSLVGDIGGGALYLAMGLLAAVMSARSTGQGQVVDAAIVDCAANMTNLLLSLTAAGQFTERRGESILDGPHWYQTYRCADGAFITVGALEPKFYEELRELLGLADDPAFGNHHDKSRWPAHREHFAALFATKTRAEWCQLLEGTDACFAPVLAPSEAAQHPHMIARKVYERVEDVLQVAPAPRFSAMPATDIPPPRATLTDVGAVLGSWA